MEKKLYTPKISKDGFNLWIAYPACESFALASLGYLWLYKLADEMSEINAQRIYTDSSVQTTNIPNAIAFSM